MSDKAIVISEKDVLNRFDEICQETLNPDVYSIWKDEIIPTLNKLRPQLGCTKKTKWEEGYETALSDIAHKMEQPNCCSAKEMLLWPALSGSAKPVQGGAGTLTTK